MDTDTPGPNAPKSAAHTDELLTTRSRSRRGLLTAALGGLGGLVLSRLAVPDPAAAAAGDALLVGNVANNAGTADTALTTSSTGTALLVTQNGSGTALRGSAVGGGSIAGFFTATNGTGISGVTGNANSYGVFASNDGPTGSAGAIRASGKNNHGLVATTDSGGVNAVRATNAGNGGALGSAIFAVGGANCTAVTGRATSGNGVFGFSTNAQGVYGSSTNSTGVQGGGNPGVHGTSTSTFGAGIFGEGYGSSGHGVVGVAKADSGNAGGIYGASDFPAAFAGYFEGKVHATGGITSVTSGVKIDHPLEPADKILLHNAVISDDALTIYAGTVTTDADGEATVQLPRWFEALNTDLRYQLTVIGSFAQAMVKHEVKGNRFGIATSEPATKVSWQVTGVRNDAYAKAQPRHVEVPKPKAQRGRYLNPVEHGQPDSKGVDYDMRRRLREPRSASPGPNLE